MNIKDVIDQAEIEFEESCFHSIKNGGFINQDDKLDREAMLTFLSSYTKDLLQSAKDEFQEGLGKIEYDSHGTTELWCKRKDVLALSDIILTLYMMKEENKKQHNVPFLASKSVLVPLKYIKNEEKTQ